MKTYAIALLDGYGDLVRFTHNLVEAAWWVSEGMYTEKSYVEFEVPEGMTVEEAWETYNAGE